MLHHRLCTVLFTWWAFQPCTGFAPLPRPALTAYPFRSSSRLHSNNKNDDSKNEDSFQDSALELKQSLDRAHNAAIVDDLFDLTSNSDSNSDINSIRPLVDLALAGHGTVGTWSQPNRSLGNQVQEKQKPIQCVFLSTPEASDEVVAHYLKRRYPTWEVPPDLKVSSSVNEVSSSSTTASSSCPNIMAVPLPIPLTRETSKELKLLSFAFRGRPISKSVFLPLSRLLTDRDGGLWDNLPWTEWTIDPQHNVPTHYSQSESGKKYLLGRRDAYNRMIGKDWYGRSVSAGNVAARMKYEIESDDGYDSSNVGKAKKQALHDSHGIRTPLPDAEVETDVKAKKTKRKQDDVHATSMDSSLAFRILQVQVQEASMELAKAESDYAMVKARFDENEFTSDEVLIAHYGEIKAAVDEVDRCMQAKKDVEVALDELQNPSLDETETQLEATINEFLENLVQSRYMGKDKSDAKEDGISSQEWKDASHKFVEGIRKSDHLMEDLVTILDREATNKWKNPFVSFLDAVIEKETKNAPPYRGAIGYAPQVDTKEEMLTKAVLPYRSPYDLLVEIIEEQFNAQVVGTVLENSCLFPETLILEGAVVLRRRGNIKSLTIGGETVEIEDSDDDMGNAGVKMGETVVVECSGAEAIGMALACNLPLSAERKVWEEVVTDVTLSSDKVEPLPEWETESVMNTIPPVVQTPNSVNRVTVTEGGEALIGGQKTEANKDLEDAIIAPIHSLADYDALTIQEKARMILSIEGTRLPRPRALRQFEKDLDIFQKQRKGITSNKEGQETPTIRTTLSPLDELLVPLLEEKSVQIEILLRDAHHRGDELAIQSYQGTMDDFYEQHALEKEKEVEERNRQENSKLNSILNTLDELSNEFEKEVRDKLKMQPKVRTEDKKHSKRE